MSAVTSSCPAPLPRVLSIAGTDPSGGAGAAADLKSIAAAGGYGMSVVTALTAQNTLGVRSIHVPPAAFLAEQLCAVSDDVVIDAVKTGMLGSAALIETISTWLEENRPPLLLVDPVMVATSGDSLLEADAEQAMVDFCARADVVTPNLEELARLTGGPVAADEHSALEQAAGWAAETGVTCVVKTGHLSSAEVPNIWVEPDGTRIRVPATRLASSSTHGTGCSLASALATRLAAGESPAAALAWSTRWLHEAIEHGEQLQVGAGHGPVDHSHRSRRLAAAGKAVPWLAADAVPAVLDAPEDLTAAAGPGAAAGPDDAAPGSSGTRASLAPAITPVGPWTAALWRAGERTARAVADSELVRHLLDGSLGEEEFSFYLAQDALYLQRYSRALAALSASSTDPEARAFWGRGAATCLTVESALHRDRLDGAEDVAISPVTSAYTDFLLASTLGEERAVGVAAVLPCYWLYAQTGATLPEVPPEHPHADWLETYRDPGFAAATTEALHQAERELADAAPVVRAAAARAYLLACRHELEFFEQALRLEHTAPAPSRETEAVAAP